MTHRIPVRDATYNFTHMTVSTKTVSHKNYKKQSTVSTNDVNIVVEIRVINNNFRGFNF